MTDKIGSGLLAEIQSPDDLKKLPESKLDELAQELRRFIINTVSKAGGHLGSNLGVVELTLALHYVYNTPVDQIVWDVGAQAYTHKIITGRRDVFHTNRQYNGISGFPRRDESPYDTFGVGHASTSISAALGMAFARDLQHEKYNVIAVIGDGSMTGGLAFEGLNNAGVSKTNLTVVFNDNNWAISPNVGALSKFVSNIGTDLRFQKVKDNVWEMAGKLPQKSRIRRALHGMSQGLRSMIMSGLWFERLGFRYIGPIDGHNLKEMIPMFKWAKSIDGPIVIHVKTTKGKGYSLAENDHTHLHGVNKFDPNIGPQEKEKKYEDLNYCQHFSEELLNIAQIDDKICAITPAMIEGSALVKFQKLFPERCFDVGIAEGHALTFGAGLAVQGMKPVIAIYSSFLQRAFDNLIHDIALQNLNIIFGIDRAGLVGEDGPTHHGSFDLSYLRHIPGLTLLAPRDGEQLRKMLHYAYSKLKGPVAIRFPRGAAPKFGSPVLAVENVMKPEMLRDGNKGLIISIGPMLDRCLQAADILRQKKKWDVAVL
nr:1-deoxy-D-xylulose-5-phosphate synthase [bacterium]